MAKTIVGELADLYVKYGGDRDNLTGKETTAEMIDAIEQIIETGGNNDFIVTYSASENDEITADKTFAEISAAIEAGKNVKALIASSAIMYFSLVGFESNTSIRFSFVEAASTNINVISITHNSDESIDFYDVTAAGN